MIEIEGPTFDTCASCTAYVAVDVIVAGRVQLPLCAGCLGVLKGKLCVGMVLPAAHARRTDPDTSKQAAASVNVTKGQEQVLGIIRVCFPREMFTLDDLLDAAADCLRGEKWSPSGVRSRCAELVAQGKVIRAGTTRLPSGRSAMLHRLVTS